MEQTQRSARAALYALGILMMLLLFGIVVTRFLPDTGLVDAHPTTRAAVADLAEVESALDRGASFQQFSEALRVAFATHRRSPTRNTADGRVLDLVERSLDAYAAVREAWQAELEGEWDDTIQGSRVYWRAAHPELPLGDGAMPLTSEEVRAVAREQGETLLRQAVDEISR